MTSRSRSALVAGLVCVTMSIGPSAGARSIDDPCVPLSGISDRCPSWAGGFASAELIDDIPMDVVAAPGAVFTLGYTNAADSGIDWTLVAHDAASGALRWNASYRGDEAWADLPEALAVDPSGSRVFATGMTCLTAPDIDTCDLVVVAYDAATGAKLWEVRRDGPAHQLDGGGDVVVSPDGASLFVAGMESRPDTGTDSVLLGLDAATGALLWDEHYDGSGGFDTGLGVASSGDGTRVYLMGSSDGVATGRDYVTLAVGLEEDEDGEMIAERLWAARRDDHGGSDNPTGLSVVAGNVVVTGTTDEGIQGLIADYGTVAYDEVTGEQAWAATYNGGTNDLPLDMAASADAVYVTGMSRGTSTGYDMATVAYDASDGSQRWASRYHGPGNNGDAAWAVDVSPDGRTVYVGGDTIVNPVDYLHAVIAYDATSGVQSWVGLHRGAGPQGGTLREGLDVSPNGGRVYFTGRLLALPDSSQDFLTLAYDA